MKVTLPPTELAAPILASFWAMLVIGALTLNSISHEGLASLLMTAFFASLIYPGIALVRRARGKSIFDYIAMAVLGAFTAYSIFSALHAREIM